MLFLYVPCTDPDSICAATVRMQVYYMDNYIDESLISKQRHKLDHIMKPLYTVIINTRLKSKKDCKEYVKKIATDITTFYSLGDISNADVRIRHTDISNNNNN